MRRFTYPVTLTAEKRGGGFVVTCRDLPEVVTQGESLESAIEEAEGALEAAVEMRIADGMDIPRPSARKKGEEVVGVPVGTAMKAALYLALLEQGITKSELSRRMGLNEKEGRRILDPKHATKVPTLERALHILGKRVEVVVS